MGNKNLANNYSPLVTYLYTNALSVEDKPALGAILDKMLVQFETEWLSGEYNPWHDPHLFR